MDDNDLPTAQSSSDNRNVSNSSRIAAAAQLSSSCHLALIHGSNKELQNNQTGKKTTIAVVLLITDVSTEAEKWHSIAYQAVQ